MVVYYSEYPKATLSWISTSNLSYVIINWSGNTVATSGSYSSGNIYSPTTSYTTSDLSFNTNYTFTLIPYNSEQLAGTINTMTINTTPKTGGIYATYSTSSTAQLQWYSGYSYVKVLRSHFKYVSGVLTQTGFGDLSAAVIDTTYTDYDLSGNTKYVYYITPYLNNIAQSDSNKITIQTGVQSPTDLSVNFYDSSAISLKFTIPNNMYSTSYYYTGVAVDPYGNSKTKVGTNSPLLIKDLSAGTTYTCYVSVTLDNSSVLVGKSNSLVQRTIKNISISSNKTNYQPSYIQPITSFTWVTGGSGLSFNNYSSNMCCNSTGQYVYLVINNEFYYSSNCGVSFTKNIALSALLSTNYNDMFYGTLQPSCNYSGQHVYCAIGVNSTSSLYYSSNYGVTFNSVTTPTGNKLISVATYNDPSNVYVTLDQNTVWFSSNAISGSATWTKVYTGVPSLLSVSCNDKYAFVRDNNGYQANTTTLGGSFVKKGNYTLYIACDYTGKNVIATNTGRPNTALKYSTNYGSTYTTISGTYNYKSVDIVSDTSGNFNYIASSQNANGVLVGGYYDSTTNTITNSVINTLNGLVFNSVCFSKDGNFCFAVTQNSFLIGYSTI